ncbi:MAG: transposase [Sphingobacteriales bacterium]|nr:transposase [Sphingobacteriales bacterium]
MKKNPPPIKAAKQGKPKSSKGRNLLNRLSGLQDCVLAFAKYQNVPFINNQAERDIRPAKSKIKWRVVSEKRRG